MAKLYSSFPQEVEIDYHDAHARRQEDGERAQHTNKSSCFVDKLPGLAHPDSYKGQNGTLANVEVAGEKAGEVRLLWLSKSLRPGRCDTEFHVLGTLRKEHFDWQRATLHHAHKKVRSISINFAVYLLARGCHHKSDQADKHASDPC
jgi:hypothetical protein